MPGERERGNDDLAERRCAVFGNQSEPAADLGEDHSVSDLRG